MPEKALASRILKSLLRILAGVPIISLLAAGLLEVILGATWIGRCVGLSAVVLGSVLFCSIGYWNRAWFKRRRLGVFAVLLPIGLLLYIMPAMLAPRGGMPDATARNCFLHGQGSFPCYWPSNVIPEVDQINELMMGYSNGAMGVTRAAVQAPELFAGLVYLSPVTEDEFFSTKEFLIRAKDRKILFLHGSRDDRIPPNLVEGTATHLKRLGCDVRLKIFDGEDHWLLFSRPEAVLDEVWECMRAE